MVSARVCCELLLFFVHQRNLLLTLEHQGKIESYLPILKKSISLARGQRKGGSVRESWSRPPCFHFSHLPASFSQDKPDALRTSTWYKNPSYDQNWPLDLIFCTVAFRDLRDEVTGGGYWIGKTTEVKLEWNYVRSLLSSSSRRLLDPW